MDTNQGVLVLAAQRTGVRVQAKELPQLLLGADRPADHLQGEGAHGRMIGQKESR